MDAMPPEPAPNETWLLAVHSGLTQDLLAWLAARGLQVGRLPSMSGDGLVWTEPVWITTPTDERLATLVRAEGDADLE